MCISSLGLASWRVDKQWGKKLDSTYKITVFIAINNNMTKKSLLSCGKR